MGVGFGFSYTPKADTEELQELFELAARQKRVSFIHMSGVPVAQALHEVIALSAVTGASVHVVHIGASSTKKFDTAMSIIEGARAHKIDITTEAYPYIAGMTRLETAIFDPGWQERLGITYEDLMWVATGERITAKTFDRFRKQGGLIASFTNTEEMVRKCVAHPLVMIASDGIMENGKGHPRVWRQLYFPISDNYISLLTTTTSFTVQPSFPTLVQTGAEDKALQGCNLSADSGARPGQERACPALAVAASSLGWRDRVKSRRSGGGASGVRNDLFLIVRRRIIRPPIFSFWLAPCDSWRCSVPGSRCDEPAGRWPMP